jgi:tetratricopeptide (TPR) repeat protein
MKRHFTIIAIIATMQFAFTGAVHAQLTSIPDGGNKKASVSEQIGITNITINYSRPGVKKRDGHIWGELIPPGFVDQGFGPSKAAPWRAGANENTTIEFTTDVKINGQPLAAGKYGFFVAYSPADCIVIFSKNSNSWGSFFYNPAEDALRINVKPQPTDKSVEWLKYEFANQTPTSAEVKLQWEKLVIPFKIDVDVVNTQITLFRNELRTDKGFNWTSWDQAASYCVQNKVNLNEALLWADSATGPFFGGSNSFQAWSTKAAVLESLDRPTEATATMKKAITFGDENQLYQYGRSLTRSKKSKEAFDVFKINFDKHPSIFVTNLGMARGYSAMGDNKKAIEFAQKAQKQAPDKPNQDAIDKIVKTLQEGKEIN